MGGVQVMEEGFERLVDRHLKVAIEEIGPIQPWFMEKSQEWFFDHPAYPVSCSGNSKIDVTKRYPLYLREFIWYKLKESYPDFPEENISGSLGNPEEHFDLGLKKQIHLPEDIADWLESDPCHLQDIRRLMRR